MPSLFEDTAVPEFYDNVVGVRTRVPLRTSRLATKTGAYIITAADSIILADASGGAFTVTLPPAAVNNTFTIKKVDASGNVVTVDGDGAETIDGALTAALAAQYESLTVITNGANWFVV